MDVSVPSARTQAPPRERLTPSQQRAFDSALVAHRANALILLESEPGMGKTSVLRAMHQETGGKYLDAEDIVRAHARSGGGNYEEVVYQTIREAIRDNDILYYDNVGDFQAASHAHGYRRPEVFDAVFKAIYDAVDKAGKKFVCTARRTDMAAQPGQMVLFRPVSIQIENLKQADYRFIFAAKLGEDAVARIDFDRVYSFSRSLSGHYLGILCDQLSARGMASPTTGDVLDVLNVQLLKSNVDTREIENIDLSTLVGVDAIIEKLDRTILLPLREPELARELGLQPKHGVILYGPPGTGKTTIGRALAHMMKGKFFMIDGDFDHQSNAFFDMVKALFHQAQRNAPSVIFIDDADVILTDPRLAYFGRYLLTQLDGLMNEASNRICVMMTAMDMRGLPLALLRSGRMEVWLEMKLPDATARSSIIESYVRRLPIPAPSFDMRALEEETEGFTPADLRRVVADATGHLAFDRHLGDRPQPFDVYLRRAATALRGQKVLANEAFGKRGGRLFH
ncbi:ATP-binding protein [Sphingomonas sp. OTU376]|uniref:ATP-binding protein n=1 Tax=Sphingomonas sp. OTU376 TaxID=3043863 RepID=UPI00313C5917